MSDIKCLFKEPGKLCGSMKVGRSGSPPVETCGLEAGKCDHQGFEQPLINMDSLEKQNKIYLEVLEFAVETDEPKAFLRCWLEGDWEPIKNEWPEFKGYVGDKT